MGPLSALRGFSKYVPAHSSYFRNGITHINVFVDELTNMITMKESRGVERRYMPHVALKGEARPSNAGNAPAVFTSEGAVCIKSDFPIRLFSSRS